MRSTKSFEQGLDQKNKVVFDKDFDYLITQSGEVGSLSAMAEYCEELNKGLTSMMDSLHGPEVTDSFDASCNTCKHFQRKPMTKEEKSERNIFGMPGLCGAKLVNVSGWQRGQYCGFENAECYENRRTGMTPLEAEDVMRKWAQCT